MKFIQNSFGTTIMKIGEIIASAGVKNAKDFDYGSLLKIAKHKSTIEVA
nr:MAG TPA: hypothetical protein [Caudoviricetes sp.]